MTLRRYGYKIIVLCILLVSALWLTNVALAMGAGSEVDANFSVFLSDPHVPGDGVKPDKWEIDFSVMQNRLADLIDEILAMQPRPANVVVFGDVAYLRGEEADYRKSAPLYRKLEAAGIRVTIGMGNHDKREPFLKFFPEYRTSTLVPGEIVSLVPLGHADLFLLDSLNETSPGQVGMSEAQKNWIEKTLPKWNRPFFLGAHHPANDIPFGKRSLAKYIVGLKNFRGFIHGDWHVWQEWTMLAWGNGGIRRAIGLPSTGFWGDIGYVTFRTDEKMATATLVQREFYFPRFQPDPAKRDPMWAVRTRENNGRTVRFALQPSL